jgi:methionyl aminopeptidase
VAIYIKNENQINFMRIAGDIVAKTHELLEKAVRPGITTKELDKIAEEFIRSQGATPSFLGYNGYPASICASVNEEIIHGIPSLKKLKDGDIISIDIGAYINGYHGDAARTHAVGNISSEAEKLIQVTKDCFFEGIKFAKEGCHLHEISEAIQNYVEQNGFSVVREYVGHGIGRAMHEQPHIPNYKPANRGPKLLKGMVLAIEPMVNIGTHEIKTLSDGWTVVTRDKKYSAHYENTVLITDHEPELLTIY